MSGSSAPVPAPLAENWQKTLEFKVLALSLTPITASCSWTGLKYSLACRQYSLNCSSLGMASTVIVLQEAAAIQANSFCPSERFANHEERLRPLQWFSSRHHWNIEKSFYKKEILQLDVNAITKQQWFFNVAVTTEAIVCNLLFIFIYKKINLK